ncbi:FtsX-like permease family protein [Streptomyces sp. NPDC004838]
MKAVAPWVRTRLRTAPVSALATLALVLVSSFLAAAFPRGVEAYEGAGLRHEMSVAPADRSGVQLTDVPPDFGGPEPAERAAALRPAKLAEQHRKILASLPEPLRADAGQSAYGVRTPTPVRSTDRWMPQLDGGAPVLTLSAGAGLAEHSAVRSGRLPRATAATAESASVEGAVTTATADALNIEPGSTVHVPRPGGTPLAVKITGIVEPVRPQDAYWSVEPVLRTPTLRYTPAPPAPQPYWHGALLLAPEAGPALLSVATDAEAYWRIAIDSGGLRVDDLPHVRAAIASLEGGPAQAALRAAVSPALDVESGLDDVLIGYEGIVSAIDPVVGVAAFGAGGVVAVVLLMAGGLAAARRHAELALLRARGGSVRGIAGRLFAETAVPAVPAAALGCWLALVLVPEGRLTPSLLASAAVALTACAGLPLRAAFLHRGARPHGGRDDVVRARPSRRRTVAELTLLVLAVAAVVALRRRGTSGEGADELVSAAPVLVGMVAALVLVRLYPLPLRIAALPMARRRGAVGFLALARTGRSPATTALPLLALLLALTTAAFGGSVLAGIADARDRAALLAVGADARLEAATELPGSLAGAVGKLDGVREVVSVRRERDFDLRDSGSGLAGVTLIAAEPDAYARLARSTGLGGFGADELRKRSAGPLPALVSPGVAERLGGREATIGPTSALFTVRVTAVRDTTPAVTGGEFVVVDASGLPSGFPVTTLLVSGPSVSGTELTAAARAAGGGVDVRLRSAERDGFTQSPVQSGAERIYAVATATGAGYAVLALLLSLLQAAPERAALLARLRTMGLTRRQGRRLLILESLPPALLAAAGGALVGWATIRLLSPGVGLDRLALAAQARPDSPVPVRLTADPGSLLLPALAVVVIAAGVAAAQAWLTTRRTSTTELRAGDTR